MRQVQWCGRRGPTATAGRCGLRRSGCCLQTTACGRCMTWCDIRSAGGRGGGHPGHARQQRGSGRCRGGSIRGCACRSGREWRRDEEGGGGCENAKEILAALATEVCTSEALTSYFLSLAQAFRTPSVGRSVHGTAPLFFFADHGSDSQLNRSWRTWTRQRCSGKVAGFFGSATNPCGPCFAPQSATRRLVASASPSGRHSEEPQVVVVRATQTTKNSTGPGSSK